MVYFGLLRGRPYGTRIRPARGDLFMKTGRPRLRASPQPGKNFARGGSWLRITPVAHPPRSPKLETLLLAVALMPVEDRSRGASNYSFTYFRA